MRNALLYLPIIFLLAACGGEEEEKEPTVVPGASETSHTKETVINNPMDSALMAEYMRLTKDMKKVEADSLKFQLDSIAANNDSLMEMIMNMKASIDQNLPVKFPEPDLTDYNIPPYGNTNDHSYFAFESWIPEKGKELKELPKEIRGTYSKPDNAQIVISKNDILYTSSSGEETKLFNIASDQIYTQSDNYYLLQYEVAKEWVVVTLELSHGNLSYRIIPKGAKLSTKPTKKELKTYLGTAKRTLYQVYAKVK